MQADLFELQTLVAQTALLQHDLLFPSTVTHSSWCLRVNIEFIAEVFVTNGFL